MAKSIDALTRSLLEAHPVEWLDLLDLMQGEPATVVNSDVSTVTAEADKVIRVEGPEPWLVHIELQTGYDRTLPRRLLRYNALLNVRHNLPVHSVAVLLSPEADGPALDGVLRQRSPDGRCSLEFHYHLVRAWELPTAAVLAGGRGVLPLAPMTAATPEDVPAIIEELKRRVDPAGTTREDADFWLFTALLTALRFEWDQIEGSFLGITAMRQSSFYEHILSEGRALGLKEGIVEGIKEGIEEGKKKGEQEGRVLEARELILYLGRERFGDPDEQVRDRIAAITDLDRLKSLAKGVLTASDWKDLLRMP